MKVLSSNIFSVIEHFAENNSVRMVWLPDSRHMSNIEFTIQINTLFSTMNKLQSKILFLDASEFYYYIPENSFAHIKCNADKSHLLELAIVKGRDILGSYSIKGLVQHISHSGIHISVFETQEEGNSWFAQN